MLRKFRAIFISKLRRSSVVNEAYVITLLESISRYGRDAEEMQRIIDNLSLDYAIVIRIMIEGCLDDVDTDVPRWVFNQLRWPNAPSYMRA